MVEHSSLSYIVAKFSNVAFSVLSSLHKGLLAGHFGIPPALKAVSFACALSNDKARDHFSGWYFWLLRFMATINLIFFIKGVCYVFFHDDLQPALSSRLGAWIFRISLDVAIKENLITPSCVSERDSVLMRSYTICTISVIKPSVNAFRNMPLRFFEWGVIFPNACGSSRKDECVIGSHVLIA